MIEDHYSINVAKQDGFTWDDKPRYLHYCKVTLSGTMNLMEIRRKFADFKQRFPEPEFHLTLLKVTCRGEIFE